MSAGSMSQSVALPREMLEALGEYKEALKDVKGELKGLEKEAKRIEKSGGLVPDDMKRQIESARGERNRLEDRINQQKAQKQNQRQLRQARGSLRRAFTDPSGFVLDRGLDRLSRTAIGRKLEGYAAAATAKVGSMLSKQVVGKNFLGGATVGGIAGAASLGAGIGVAVIAAANERNRFRQRGAEGAAQTEEVLTGIISGAAIGGSLAANFDQIQAQARSEGAAAKKAIDNAGVYSKLKSLIYGGTSAGQDIEDKIIQQSARRAEKIGRYGAGYGDAVDISNIKRKRRMQYRKKMYEEMGYINYAANTAFEMFSGDTGTEFVDATSMISHAFGLGITGDIKSAEVRVNEAMKEVASAKWEEDKKVRQADWNDTSNIRFALERADAHERQNAITAFNTDKLQRGLTWSLQ